MADHDHDDTFETTDAAGSLTYPVQCSALRKGGYVMIKGTPCKIIEMTTSKTGKHGHAKCNLTGTGIFDGKKYECMQSSTHNMDVPNVARIDYDLIDMKDDGYLSLMTPEGDTRDDICVNDPTLRAEIQGRLDEVENGTAQFSIVSVTILSAMDILKPIVCKVIN